MSLQRRFLFICSTAMVALGTALGGWSPAGADGTEELGPPSIPIESGSGIVIAGVGLEDAQPATINIEVPAGAVVKQVLLYWEGQNGTPTGDDTIVVEGAELTGTLIGGPTLFFTAFGEDYFTSTYRADITGLGLVAPGPNAISVGGLTFDQVSDGAGLTVIYDDGTSSDITVVDGTDTAFINFPSPRDTTVAQTFTFAPAPIDRTGSLSMHFSSVVGPDVGGDRPEIIEITVDGVTTQFPDRLASADGNEWDTERFEFLVPAGATVVSVQALSADSDGDGQNPLAASLIWVAANLTVPSPPPPPTTTTPPVTLPPTTTIEIPPITLPPTTAPPVTTIAPTTTLDIPVITAIPVTSPPTTEPPAPTTTQPPTVILPETGAARTQLPLGTGMITLGFGLALLAVARRQPNTSN